MRIAVSGSHGTGKSTLIASFLDACPQYAHEPEAFEVLGDEITLTESGGPDLEGLAALLELTVSTLASYRPGDRVVFERSPVDYLAYAVANPSLALSEREDFLGTYLPTVRAAVRDLELIALLPVSSEGSIAARPGEDEDFRHGVDDALHRALLDDDHDLFDGHGAPPVLELPPSPSHRLAELLRWVDTDARARR